MTPAEYAALSLWSTHPDLDWTPRPALTGSAEADVAIVGAGFTGLWTAHHLLRHDPTLRVVVLEAQTAGFGASGRNGGWCSALFPASWDSLAALPASSRAAALAQQAAMEASVDQVGEVCGLLSVPFVKGGTITLARGRAQVARAQAEVAHARAWGRPDPIWLGRDEATARLAGQRVDGATYTPHCAALHPALLARRLAEEVERQGALIAEQTPVLGIEHGSAVTAAGTVSAEVVVRATEGYTPSLAGQRRVVAPVYSLIIATEPLSPAIWDEIGLARRETFSEHRNLIVYGQRTPDDRMLFGGRGAPYHFGSRVRPEFDRDPRVFAGLHATLLDLFPALRGTRIEHAWGGPLGVPRDWCATVGLDRSAGFAWAGGYVGDGVSTTQLAGRTLADLILGRDSELVRLPWVGHRSPRWEPEPLRWLGVNAGLRAMTLADVEERVTRRPSVIARAMAPLLGH